MTISPLFIYGIEIPGDSDWPAEKGPRLDACRASSRLHVLRVPLMPTCLPVYLPTYLTHVVEVGTFSITGTEDNLHPPPWSPPTFLRQALQVYVCR
jgi:hypothetical protein